MAYFNNDAGYLDHLDLACAVSGAGVLVVSFPRRDGLDLYDGSGAARRPGRHE